MNERVLYLCALKKLVCLATCTDILIFFLFLEICIIDIACHVFALKKCIDTYYTRYCRFITKFCYDVLHGNYLNCCS